MKATIVRILITLLALVLIIGIAGLVMNNKAVRKIGGTINVEVPKGEKVISATIKDDGSIFYLTEPMENSYIPKIKYLRENSNLGIIESTVKFKESK